MLEVVLITIVIASFFAVGGYGIVVFVLALAFWWWQFKGWNRQQDVVENVRYEGNREVDLMLTDLDMSSDELESLPLPTQKQIYDEWKQQKQTDISKAVAERMERARAKRAALPSPTAPEPSAPERDDEEQRARHRAADERRRVLHRQDIAEMFGDDDQPQKAALRHAEDAHRAFVRRRDGAEASGDDDGARRAMERWADNGTGHPDPKADARRRAEEAHRAFVQREREETKASFARYMKTQGIPSHEHREMMRDPDVVSAFKKWRKLYDDEDGPEPTHEEETKRRTEAAHRQFVARQEAERQASFGRFMRKRGVSSYKFSEMMRDREIVEAFESWREKYDE